MRKDNLGLKFQDLMQEFSIQSAHNGIITIKDNAIENLYENENEIEIQIVLFPTRFAHVCPTLSHINSTEQN